MRNIKMPVKDMASLLSVLSLSRYLPPLEKHQVDLMTLCETLGAAGRPGVDDVLKEAGITAVGPRVRIQNNLADPQVCPKRVSKAEGAGAGLAAATPLAGSSLPPPPPPPPLPSPPPPPSPLSEKEKRAHEVAALLDSIGLERFSVKLTAADLNVPTLCDTLQTGGRPALDDVLKEAGINAMGPRIRLANALFELPGYTCRPSGEAAEAGAPSASRTAAPAVATVSTTTGSAAANPSAVSAGLPAVPTAASAVVSYSGKPDPMHEGKSMDTVLAAHRPSMLEYRDKFDAAKVDFAAMCEVGATGGKWAIMDKLTSIGIDVRPGHPRPRYKLAVDLTNACK